MSAQSPASRRRTWLAAFFRSQYQPDLVAWAVVATWVLAVVTGVIVAVSGWSDLGIAPGLLVMVAGLLYVRLPDLGRGGEGARSTAPGPRWVVALIVFASVASLVVSALTGHLDRRSFGGILSFTLIATWTYRIHLDVESRRDQPPPPPSPPPDEELRLFLERMRRPAP